MFNFFTSYLQKLFSNLNFYQPIAELPKEDITKQKPLTVRQQILICLDELNIEGFNPAPAEMMSTIIHPLFKNINEYNIVLNDLTHVLERKEVLRPDYIQTNISYEISLDQFFISGDGYYVHVQVVMADFYKFVENFCIALEPSDTATHGIWEHNRRMLMKPLNNLLDIVQALVNISLTKEE